MAKVRIEGILDDLSRELTRALATAVENNIPDASFDPSQLFNDFKSQAYSACLIWEKVAEKNVKQE